MNLLNGVAFIVLYFKHISKDGKFKLWQLESKKNKVTKIIIVLFSGVGSFKFFRLGYLFLTHFFTKSNTNFFFTTLR